MKKIKEINHKKLQDKNNAKAFGLLSSSEKQIMLQAGVENCLTFKNKKWIQATKFEDNLTYILKSDYSPPYGWRAIGILDRHDAPSILVDPSGWDIFNIITQSNFSGFWCEDERITLDEVADKKAENKEVYIRIRIINEKIEEQKQ